MRPQSQWNHTSWLRGWGHEEGDPPWALKHHKYVSIKPSKHHSALGVLWEWFIWNHTLYLSRDCGQENLNSVRYRGAPGILSKMMSFHLLLWKLLPVLAGHCIHGNIAFSFCLKLHTRAHTNKSLLMDVHGTRDRWHSMGDTAASTGQLWALCAMAQCFL